MVDTKLIEYIEHDLDEDSRKGGHRGLELASYVKEKYRITTKEEATQILHRQRNMATNSNVSEEENQLERNLAEALYLSILERGFSLDDYPDTIKDILREAGHEKICINGEELTFSRVKRPDLISYAENILIKYNFPINPTRF